MHVANTMQIQHGGHTYSTIFSRSRFLPHHPSCPVQNRSHPRKAFHLFSNFPLFGWLTSMRYFLRSNFTFLSFRFCCCCCCGCFHGHGHGNAYRFSSTGLQSHASVDNSKQMQLITQKALELFKFIELRPLFLRFYYLPGPSAVFCMQQKPTLAMRLHNDYISMPYKCISITLNYSSCSFKSLY